MEKLAEKSKNEISVSIEKLTAQLDELMQRTQSCHSILKLCEISSQAVCRSQL